MCAEELATVARYDLPIKIFIFNNQGHGIQKQTIETWLDGRYEALDKKTGLFFPDFADGCEPENRSVVVRRDEGVIKIKQYSFGSH